MQKEIYCCKCKSKIQARLTDGSEIYPHRKDLHDLPFWKCDSCNNFVGCHHKTKNRIEPLGIIPTKEIKEARKHIHALIDPLWKNKLISRKELYSRLTKLLGWEYHTANIRSIEEARQVYRLGLKIKKILQDCWEEAGQEAIKDLYKQEKHKMLRKLNVK